MAVPKTFKMTAGTETMATLSWMPFAERRGWTCGAPLALEVPGGSRASLPGSLFWSHGGSRREGCHCGHVGGRGQEAARLLTDRVPWLWPRRANRPMGLLALMAGGHLLRRKHHQSAVENRLCCVSLLAVASETIAPQTPEEHGLCGRGMALLSKATIMKAAVHGLGLCTRACPAAQRAAIQKRIVIAAALPNPGLAAGMSSGRVGLQAPPVDCAVKAADAVVLSSRRGFHAAAKLEATVPQPAVLKSWLHVAVISGARWSRQLPAKRRRGGGVL
mmetsp:Transcript_14046/g.39783  ORF Transcript_14046/g.39783 Transcript_14046/m.39783 type:complete len:275 (-) Transcript_14046:303-1127(-)